MLRKVALGWGVKMAKNGVSVPTPLITGFISHSWLEPSYGLPAEQWGIRPIDNSRWHQIPYVTPFDLFWDTGWPSSPFYSGSTAADGSFVVPPEVVSSVPLGATKLVGRVPNDFVGTVFCSHPPNPGDAGGYTRWRTYMPSFAVPPEDFYKDFDWIDVTPGSTAPIAFAIRLKAVS